MSEYKLCHKCESKKIPYKQEPCISCLKSGIQINWKKKM